MFSVLCQFDFWSTQQWNEFWGVARVIGGIVSVPGKFGGGSQCCEWSGVSVAWGQNWQKKLQITECLEQLRVRYVGRGDTAVAAGCVFLCCSYSADWGQPHTSDTHSD
jgi:hypothetical protein